MIEKSTIFSDFCQQLEKEKAELHSISDRIEAKLHMVKNTNYPQDGSQIQEKCIPRGNDDLEYELFSSLESLQRLRQKLYSSLEKLESII